MTRTTMTDDEPRARFLALLREHQKIVLKVASVYARGAQDRNDLAQEIAVQLWRSFPRYDPERRFSTWMYRVALNVGISFARRERARDGRFEPLADPGDVAADSDEPDERLKQLHAVIAGLAELDRALIVLYLEERPHSEIAAILGISETNVATKLGRLKQRLRGRMT
ncbi:sigma-70 family RNA polymerase sigma factor [Nannocystis pusilla]|uniref:Sigma-70 family RNA polymerase sigma factor n=2 Tax=Nannocystis pusilla TaxID=889268 RepID=A0ABS7U2N2_9BACT|nr:sigma-70 family RNA polymerase sigma factor [Nannocystis pusilla]MBZ5714725.1 sigma-70 family RNA polymerase sigma factor [Nannocystis pusilla]